MHRLEDGHEVVLSRPLGVGRVREQERDPIGHALALCVRLRALDRPGVDVDAVDVDPRERARDRDRRPAGPAGHVRDPTLAIAQLRGDVRQRADPIADEVRELRSIESFLGLDDIGAVVRPVDALPVRYASSTAGMVLAVPTRKRETGATSQGLSGSISTAAWPSGSE